MIRTPTGFLLLVALLSGCGQDNADRKTVQEQPATAAAPSPATTKPKAKKSVEALYQTKLVEVFSTNPQVECQGLSRQSVATMHARRQQGLSGSILTASDQALLYCENKVRLLAEGRKEFHGL